MNAALVPRGPETFSDQLHARAAAIAQYAAAASDSAESLLGNPTFLLDDFYVRPIAVKGHGRGAQVVFHRVHEPADMERKIGLAKFMREAVPQERF